ncbi:MAG: amidohydrolase family protein [Burkholderiaceae bacterium]
MGSSIVIRNGTIVDGTGRAGYAGTLVIEANRIARVAEGDAPVALPPGAREVDARGQTVMPGLIDAHCHLAFDDAASNAEIFHQRRNALSALVASYNARKLLRAGVTGFLDPDSVFENMIDLRDAVEAGVVPGPRMSCGAYALITGVGGTAGRLINDHGSTGYYMAVNSRDELVAEIRRQIKIGTDWIKVHVTGVVPRKAHLGELCAWNLDELRLICDTAHALHTPVMGHCRGAEATRLAAEAGFDFILHATGMDERALEAIIERRIPIAPTLTFQANLIDYGHRIGTDSSLVDLFAREIADSAPTLKAVHDAGVPLLCGSEAGFSMVPYGEWHYREMEVFVRDLGMTPLEAISCATRNGAFALRLEGEVGTLEPGKLADVICVHGRVDEDVCVLAAPDAVRTVIKDGVVQDLSDLPERRPIPGWRLATMGEHLSRSVAFGAGAARP